MAITKGSAFENGQKHVSDPADLTLNAKLLQRSIDTSDSESSRKTRASDSNSPDKLLGGKGKSKRNNW